MTRAEGLAGLRLVGPAGCMEALFFTPKAMGIHTSRGNISGLMPQGEWTGEEAVGAAGPVRRLLQGSGWGMGWPELAGGGGGAEVAPVLEGDRMHAGGPEWACDEHLWC